jgi:hypothetical protein
VCTLTVNTARRLLEWTLIIAAQGTATAYAAVLHGDPDTYTGLVRQLNPGDTLDLAPGIYRDDLVLHDVHGAAGRPIVIRGGADHGTVFVGRSGHNTVSLSNAAYIEIRDLVLDGRGLLIDAVKAEGPSRWAHHITLDGLVIYGYGAEQQNVGVSTKCPAWNWVVRDSIIDAAGTGMYFGSSDGSAPFIDGLIEHNVVLNTVGYNLQIKHQNPWPALPLDKHRPRTTIIRYNVFSKAGGGSAGRMARPNVLTDRWPPSGAGQEDTYLIYGNFFYENPTEALFQGEGNIALYDNILINDFGDAVAMEPHHGKPRRIDVFNNTIVASGVGLAVRGGDQGFSQRVVGNAIFAAVPIVGGTAADNITGGYTVAGEYLNEPAGAVADPAVTEVRLIELQVRRALRLARDQPPDGAAMARINAEIAAGRARLSKMPTTEHVLDLYPRPGRISTASIAADSFPAVPDADRDFNGTPRAGRFRGAYAGEGHNPGEPLQLGRLAARPATGSRGN